MLIYLCWQIRYVNIGCSHTFFPMPMYAWWPRAELPHQSQEVRGDKVIQMGCAVSCALYLIPDTHLTVSDRRLKLDGSNKLQLFECNEILKCDASQTYHHYCGGWVAAESTMFLLTDCSRRRFWQPATLNLSLTTHTHNHTHSSKTKCLKCILHLFISDIHANR